MTSPSTEQLACQVLGCDGPPRDAWWELGEVGAEATASLVEDGVQMVIKPWLRQWLELSSPSHDPVRSADPPAVCLLPEHPVPAVELRRPRRFYVQHDRA